MYICASLGPKNSTFVLSVEASRIWNWCRVKYVGFQFNYCPTLKVIFLWKIKKLDYKIYLYRLYLIKLIILKFDNLEPVKLEKI